MSFQISASVLLQDVQIKIAQREQEILTLESQIQPLPEAIIGNCRIVFRITSVQKCDVVNEATRRILSSENNIINNRLLALRSELEALKIQETNLLRQVSQDEKRFLEELQFERETQFLLKEQELLSEQLAMIPAIGDITPQLPQITPQNNTLRNALIVGGALLLIL